MLRLLKEKAEESITRQKQHETAIRTSKSMYIFVHYIMWIWICDVINMVALFTNNKQDTLFINALALIFIVLIVKFDFKLFVFERTDFNCSVGICILGVIALVYSIYPDISADSLVYHVMNQDPVWQGKNGLSFWNASFPLADRLFYLFRYLLGYKLGTMFNWVLISLTYVQIVRIFKLILLRSNTVFDRIFNPYLWAFLCVSLEIVMVDIGTYMTDYTGIPLVLEAVICLMSMVGEKEEKQTNLFKMIYYVICLAFLFLMKLTTLIYVIPLLVIYLVSNRKQITYKTFLWCLFVGVILVFPQLFYNYVITGRLFYPFYILSGSKGLPSSGLPSSGLLSSSGLVSGGESPYDNRWGATNLFEMIFWPVFMALKPKYRHMEMVKMPNLYPLLLVLCSLAFLIKKIIKKDKNEKSELLVLVSVMSLYLWIGSRTVDRYAFAAIILCGIVTVCIVYSFFYSKGTIILMAALFLFQAGCCYYSFMILGTNFKWPPAINEVLKEATEDFTDTYYWRSDRGKLVTNNQEYVYHVSPYKRCNVLGYLINENAVFYDVSGIKKLSENKNYSELYNELYDLQQRGEKFYTASLPLHLPEVIERLATCGFEVVDMDFLADTYFAEEAGNIVIYKFVLSENPNGILMSDSQEKIEMEVETENGDNILLGGFVFVNPIVTWTKDAASVDFYVIDDGEKIVLSHKELVPGEVNYIKIDIDTSLCSDSKLYIESKDNYGLDVESVYIVNMKQIEIDDMEWENASISFEGSQDTSDNPWGQTAGFIEMEEVGKCILLTPNTSFSIQQLTDIGKFSFSYEIHPWVRENSDGAGILIWIMDENDTILHEEVIRVDVENEWEKFEMDLNQYDGVSKIKVFCNNGGGNDDGDWVIVKMEK